MTSALNTIREMQRQKATGDTKFCKHMLMFFELRIPEGLGTAVGTTFLFPLMLSPESYSLDEPFALDATPTQGGGVYAEEHGIVQRVIRLSGTTGFAPKPMQGNGPGALAAITPAKRSYTRSLPASVLESLSGQRHFQYLQDAVFRTYGDLKRDPTTAEKTKLFFHIPKDDEHWLVLPQRFQLSRSVGAGRTLYHYEIELLAIDRAVATNLDVSEDTSWMSKMMNAVAMVKTGIALAQGAIDDLTNVVNEIKKALMSVVAVIDGVKNVITAAENFVTGVTDLIDVPLATIESLHEMIDEGSRLGHMDVDAIIMEKWLQLGDALDLIGAHAEVFEPDGATTLTSTAQQTNPLVSQSAAIAAAQAAPTTVAGYVDLGTGLTLGEATQANAAQTFAAPEPPRYRSSRQVRLQSGDTLASLAARYLGDARRWQDIAAINGLLPPFTETAASADLATADETTLPGVRGIGDKILVPSTSKGMRDLPNPVVLGARADESTDVRLLGRDFKLSAVTEISQPGNLLYDVPIDVEGGSTDVLLISGRDNLAQGLVSRLSTERGTDLLYLGLGMERVIGTKHATTDLELVRYRAQQALQQDPRIANVRRVTFLGVDDGTEIVPGMEAALSIDSDVEVRGYFESANVRVTV